MTGQRDKRDERPLTAAEEQLWRAAVGDIEPSGESPQTPPEPDGTDDSTEQKRPAPARPRPPVRPAAKPPPRVPPAERGAVPGLDRRSAERLRRGRMPIDARLDLHGLTQERAHAALNEFLAHAHGNGARCVLVITGKGSARPGRGEGFMPDRGLGVLREMVPRWLAEPGNRSIVVAVQPARPHHGGAGALYVLLRRARGGMAGSEGPARR